MANGLGGTTVAGFPQGEITPGLALTDPNVWSECFGQLATGLRPLLAEEFGQRPGYGGPTRVVGIGAGRVGEQRLGASGVEAFEGGPNGVRVSAQVFSNLGCRPPGVGQGHHFQAVTSNGRMVRAAKGLKFGTLRISEWDAEHETFYASQAECLEPIPKPLLPCR